MTTLAISLAVLAAAALAFGAHFQHSAVGSHDDTHSGLSLAHLGALLKNKTWLLGLLVLGSGTVGNVTALALAPVMVVQPVGALSLIISVLIGMRYRGLQMNRKIVQAVVWCTIGVVAFVSLAAVIARSEVHFGSDAHVLAWITVVAVAVFAVTGLLWRSRPQLVLVAEAGVLFATVATNVHVISVQFIAGGIAAVTWFNVAMLVVAAALGSWFVQNAYAAGPPEMVIAGLTVIDPIIAVVLGSVVLGEASHAPWWLIVVMAVTGLAAGFGVVVLSRYHPDVLLRNAERRQHRADRARSDVKKPRGV